MSIWVRETASRHRVFLVYLMSVLWLALAAQSYTFASGSGVGNSIKIVAFSFAVTLVYVAFVCLSKKKIVRFSVLADGKCDELCGNYLGAFRFLVFSYIAVIVAHLGYIGNVPIWEALTQTSDVSISIVRQQSYFDLPVYIRYLSDYSLKALGPALLIIAYYYRACLFWIILAAGTLYCLALFARILPIMFLLPLMCLQFTQRQWLHLVVTFSLMSSLVMIITVVASVTLRAPSPVEALPAPWVKDWQVSDWQRNSALYALYERAVIVPGQVMQQWFSYYQQDGSTENGCAYRPVAKVVGCNYVHVPTKLYAIYYPENVKQGMHGSLNSAAFMTDFANFGLPGFAISALLCGLLFGISFLIYGGHVLALPFNLPLILVLMESNFFTAINSGSGWLVMTALFFLFFRPRFK